MNHMNHNKSLKCKHCFFVLFLFLSGISVASNITWENYSLDMRFDAGDELSFAKDRFFYGSKYSLDGGSWHQLDTNMFEGGFISKVIYDGKRFIALTRMKTITSLFTSTEGLSWTRLHTFDSTVYLHSIAWCKDKYIAAGYKSDIFSNLYAQVFMSIDCITWTEAIDPPPRGYMEDVVCCENSYLAIGSVGLIYYSSNGRDWQQQPSVARFTKVKAIEGHYYTIAGGSINLIARTQDGAVWEKVLDASGSLNDIAWGNNQFITAMCPDSDSLQSLWVYTSSDGITWTYKTIPTQNPSYYHKIEFGNNSFLVFGEYGSRTEAFLGKTSASTVAASFKSYRQNILQISGNYVSYNLPISSLVSLSLFDVRGRLVRNLVNNEHQSAGTHSVELKSNLKPGTYIVSLKSGTHFENKTFVVNRSR